MSLVASTAMAATSCTGHPYAGGAIARSAPATRMSADARGAAHAATHATTTPPGRTLAYSEVGTTVVAVAYRVPRATNAQGPITVVRFNSKTTRLVLHAGGAEPAAGLLWHYGPQIAGPERSQLIAAFNGGFKMHDAHGGWLSEGRTVVPLIPGAASVVIYSDGGFDIGAWGREVPAAGRRVVSVRQNLSLLIDHARANRLHAPDQAVLNAWWGHAFLDEPLIARSALGITADGSLVWAAGTNITVAALAHALLTAGVVRAMELDINAPLVRGFLYAGAATVHSTTQLSQRVLPLVIGQRQLRRDPGQTNPNVAPHCTYLLPCSRDFFTVLDTVVKP